jgi:hypothetical protein
LVVGLLRGDVGREPGSRSALPVVLAGFEENPIAGMDDFDGAALLIRWSTGVPARVLVLPPYQVPRNVRPGFSVETSWNKGSASAAGTALRWG